MIRLPHLETDVTQECQLSCVACNHFVPLWREYGAWSSTPTTVEHDLSILSGFVRTDAWGALGGEPLLNPRLVDILRVVKATRIADKIQVWTNGILLFRMGEEFWRAVDEVVLSRYPHTLDDVKFNRIVAECKEHGVELTVKDERVAPNFRSLLEPLATDPAETERKFRGCFFRGFSRVLNHGWFFTCCVAPHLPFLMQSRSYGSDGIRIDRELTEPRLREYLERRVPLGACEMCAGRDTAVPIRWQQARDPYHWVLRSQGRC